MRVNVTRIKAIQKEHTVELIIQEKGEKYPHSIYLTKAEADFLLQDDPPITPCIRDIMHWAAFYADCVVFCKANSDEAEWHYLNVPLYLIKAAINASTRESSHGFEYNEASMQRYAFLYRPRHVVVYADEETRLTVIEHGKVLKKWLVDLVRWSRSHSIFGEVVTLHIWDEHSTKDMPSFYWWMEREGHQILNGGLIWHGGTCGYSVHT
jgi:hypothetical protein